MMESSNFRAVALLIILLAPLAINVASSAQQQQSSLTATPITHVIVVMMENHSFDNLFGVYPTDNNSANARNQIIGSVEMPSNLLDSKVSSGLSAVPNGTFSTENPTEGYDAYHNDYDGGAMDGFAANSGPQSMTYFTSSQLAIEWDWAEEYGLGDNYFSSYLSATAPNRLMSLAGYTPVTSDYGPPPYISVNSSIFGQLSSSGVSWGYYVDGPSTSAYPLEYFSNLNEYSVNIRDWSDFASELSSSSLPSVSFVMPVGGNASGVDQHPPDNVTEGEAWLLGVVDEVMKSPYWSSSAIFVNYDEGGGYYDHVAPPTLDGMQLGFRVPFLVISPYAKEDYVSHSFLNHDSILAFIEYNWHLPALNSFVGSSVVPLDFFDFNETYSGGNLARPALVLNSSSSFPQNFQIPLGQFPYARSGSSSLTLEGPQGVSFSLSSSSEISLSSSFSHYFPVIAAVAVFIFAIAALAAGRRRRRYRRY
jgi:phospholipase C